MNYNGVVSKSSPSMTTCFMSMSPSSMRSRRYGPPIKTATEEKDSDTESEEEDLARREEEFRNVLKQVMTVKRPEHIPSLLTNHLNLLLGMRQSEVLQRILVKARQENDVGMIEAAQVVVNFLEEFVQHAQKVDAHYKKLLGDLIHQAKEGDEDAFDEYVSKNRQEWTPGFLRHLNGECDRISSAQKMTPESARLCEMLYIVQARILDEIGKVRRRKRTHTIFRRFCSCVFFSYSPFGNSHHALCVCVTRVFFQLSAGGWRGCGMAGNLTWYGG